MSSVDVHRAGAADTLAARSSEGERWINLILDLDEGVKEHGSALLHVDVVGNVLGFVVRVVGVGSIDVNALHRLLLLIGEALIELLRVVDLEHVANVCETRSFVQDVNVA